jgi:hypothetical protein
VRRYGVQAPVMHLPEQQLALVKHGRPFCTQPQVPRLHCCEQHWPAAKHI